jgi:hypothetical protein
MILTKAAPQSTTAFIPVASSVLQRQCACGEKSTGECPACAAKKEGILQRDAIGPGPVNLVPPIVHEVLRSPGQPLDNSVRAFMEPRFGYDFSGVRVHTDAQAAESARAVNASAYTVGNHVAFGSKQYSPNTESGSRLLAHELTHTIQQQSNSRSPTMVADNLVHERQADLVADAIHSSRSIPALTPLYPNVVSRQSLQPDEPLQIDRNFELDPARFIKRMDATAERETEKCEEFPGGSTDCEVDGSGTPTGKVVSHVDETNRCTRPCVERHEEVHVKQLKAYCPKLRDCYVEADKGKRPATDCFKIAGTGSRERECEAYRVSAPCVEQRLKTASECQSKENKEYGTRKLASEKCFREKNCGGSGSK